MGNSPGLKSPASILAAGGAIALQLPMPYRLHSETFSDECLHLHRGRSALQALRYNSWKPYPLF
ncbi:hypothetical protein NG799_22475 [Laspinema sp. D1]|uniref:Uncharacterized protein n=1 Tax=Laspinema palackyanum D2a TaxID=2953684 RepID=A0ABT2MWG4_9CYAN|nr:hypothetical protein [Laspinema sp. D2a]